MQRCQALELGNEDFIRPTQWARRLTSVQSEFWDQPFLWPLRFQWKSDVPACFTLFTWHIGNCLSWAVLHFGFSWWWLTAAGCVARLQEAVQTIALSLLVTLLLCLLPYLIFNPAQSGHCVLPWPEPLLHVRGLLFRNAFVLEHCGCGTVWVFGKEKDADLQVF